MYSLCVSARVWMGLHTVQFHGKQCMLLYPPPHWGLPSVCMCVCVYLCGCVREWKRDLSLSAKKTCVWAPQANELLCAADSCERLRAKQCVSVHSGVHVYDWGKERSCQVRLCQWPQKATEGHGGSQLSAMSAVKSGLDGAPANHRVSLGAGQYRK